VSIRFGILKDLGFCLGVARARLLGQLFVERCDVMEARGIFVGHSPLTVEYIALVAHFEIDHVIPDHKSKTLKQRLVGKSLLEPVSSVLNQTIQDVESTDLTVGIAILELLANSSGSFGRS